MATVWLLLFATLCLVGFPAGCCKNISSRPAVVNIGAIFTFNSTIGRVAKIAIEEAVKDVNSESSILPGTELAVTMQNSNCSGFMGMVEGILLVSVTWNESYFSERTWNSYVFNFDYGPR